MNQEIHAQIKECRHLLEEGEQAVRGEDWKTLGRVNTAYFEGFGRLRELLSGPFDDDGGLRERLVDLEQRQRRLVYEFRKGQTLIKARLEDLQFARQRLDHFGGRLSSGLDRHI